MNKFPIFLILTQILISCTSYEIPQDVSIILDKTSNKKQLSKTLNHYNDKKDSLKFKATCFLIRNMLNKGYCSGEKINNLDNFFKEVEEHRNINKKLTYKDMQLLWDSLVAKSSDVIDFKYDLEEISYKLLRTEIDQSFQVWESMPYCRHVSFKDFLNCILPYRIRKEPLEENKVWLFNRYSWIKDSMRTSDDPIKACNYINNELKSWFTFYYILQTYPGNISIANIYKGRYGVCDDMANLGAVAMRSVGIPVTIDYTPQWGNAKAGHSWNVVFDKKMKAIPFMGAESNPGEKSQYRGDAEIPAKIFRKTYEIQRNEILDFPDNIPEQFLVTDYLDVTDEYVPVSDITLQLLNSPPQTSYAYLCIFNNESWKPIFWGKITNNQATFRKMGRDIIYLPVYYQNHSYRVAANPFILNKKGKIINFFPSLSSYQSMKLTRKFPFLKKIQKYIDYMIGGRFQGANNSNFSDAVTLYKINNSPSPTMSELTILNNQKFKYVRYIGPELGYSDIAELEFYGKADNQDKVAKLSGKIIGKGENYQILNEAFDGNWTSFFATTNPGKGEWVGIELDKPEKITKIKFLPRTDDNAVRPGDEYELFFWYQGWISLGKKVADKDFLFFDNVPKNTIYWLRDRTRGKEERIFTYENGQQVWW